MHIFISVEPHQPLEYEQLKPNQLVIDCRQIEKTIIRYEENTEKPTSALPVEWLDSLTVLQSFFTESFRQTHLLVAETCQKELLIEVIFVYHFSRSMALYLAARTRDLLKIQSNKVYNLYNDMA